ncbi:hypothetical protein EV284_1953 [Streptomyces sp. BK022]|uniref:hypothetical protein n=1 Tax=Streptomyces sp. BK022 TaxID=2512123 RepID=UPI001029BBA1|nr:hypothetical protein [Streptomyces sp. BK022]RZU44487.1 hypothetical protein EV284_1953 [Streptomyces sp. BK022]
MVVSVPVSDRAIPDPELPAEVREALTSVPCQSLPSRDGQRAPGPTPRELTRRAKQQEAIRNKKMGPLGPIGFGIISAVCAYMGVAVVIKVSVSGIVFWVGVAFLVAALLTLIMCVEEVRERRADAKTVVIARQHAGKYICPCDLEQEDRALLLRAATAVDRILTSTAHRMDVVDQARNNVELREILWKVAKDAEKVNQLALKHWGASTVSAGAAVESVLSSQAAALETSRRHVTARIAALEQYAKHVKAIDDLIAQQDQLERLGSANDEYLDLIAQTSGDATATQRVQLASEEAVVMADPLADAVRRARDAAEIALPDKA